jgi:hypothetical protein
MTGTRADQLERASPSWRAGPGGEVFRPPLKKNRNVGELTRWVRVRPAFTADARRFCNFERPREVDDEDNEAVYA